MYAEVAWVLVSSGTQIQPQVILDSGYLPDYLSVSYDYENIHFLHPRYHPKIIRHIPLKMKMKMKKRSYRYDSYMMFILYVLNNNLRNI